jgi:hypothetical protein
MFSKTISAFLLLLFLIGCSTSTPTLPPPNTAIPVSNTPTLNATSTTAPTFTPTLLPTATPYGGNTFPRIAIFTELEPDDSAAGYIRIGNIDINNQQLVFGDVKLRVGTKPGNLSSGGYHDRLPPDIKWSPDGNNLAYTWAEDGKAIIYIYDYAAQKIKWELELTDKNFEHVYENGIEWSADSNWLYIEVDRKSHYVLDVNSGKINNLTREPIQGLVWHAKQPLLFFENLVGKILFYQYDPAGNQISQIEPVKFDPAKFENISSYDTYGSFDRDNNGFLFATSNKDDSRSVYLETEDNPIFELLKIESDVSRESLENIQKIIPSPDGSYYLINATGQTFTNDNYRTFFMSLAIKTQYPLIIKDVKGINGIYPFAWAPDGKSYIGYQYAIEKDAPVNPDEIVKVVIVDAATNAIVKDFEINYDKSKSIYGYFLNTLLFDSSGPTGIDITWR